MDGDDRRLSSGKRARLRSFVLGGLVGTAGTIAAARRLRRPSHRPRDAPAGLAAFEDAPCFLEVVEREAQRYREGGGEIDSGRLKPE
jgi:hypothetical protein